MIPGTRKMDRAEFAKELFLSGHNCAQSVILSFADEFRISKELALKLASGFGGGMGKQQETCGALTGAVMVLGLLNGEKVTSNEELKSRTCGSVRELFRQFNEDFSTTRCRDLTGCDLNSPEGAEKFRENRVMEEICAEYVKKTVQILESIPR
jgi:C_GCAxxG_C_C family probable redox protein